MTDPHHALVSFQRAFKAGQIRLQKGDIDPDLYVHLDVPAPGVYRFSYVRLDNGVVRAFATLVRVEPIEGLPCFQVGYAVPERFRGRGRATDVLSSAIAELQNGMARNGHKRIAIEAIVGIDNPASMKVAERVLGGAPKEVTDEFSGKPALQYVGFYGQ